MEACGGIGVGDAAGRGGLRPAWLGVSVWGRGAGLQGKYE